MKKMLSGRYLWTISIIKILQWGWTRLFLSKICDVNGKSSYGNNKWNTQNDK